MPLEPFLKWAGGKRWLRSIVADLKLPLTGKYFEPFLGSGAIFFQLSPSRARLSDTNSDLVATYKAIQAHPLAVEAALRELSVHHSDDFYYEVRESSPTDVAKRAARFIYLNRTCWNGLYRVNKLGVFNVPRGTKNQIILPSDDFESLSHRLRGADVACEDFEECIAQAAEGDLVYCDPPYTVHHNYNGFLKYNEKIFSWDDQVRLRSCAEAAVARGAAVVISNADHISVVELFSGLGEMKFLDRPSVISGSVHGRGRFSEILVHAPS
ncbi:MAG TPA: Dam family site-specific DNA-(adenine-N6)-methyltransferase [Allosphingosinicella sp.]|jgi:DNA adenine methylase